MPAMSALVLQVAVGGLPPSATVPQPLMVLPSLIVGNELLILGGVGTIVGAWFLAHRHGQLRGLVEENGKRTDGSTTTENA